MRIVLVEDVAVVREALAALLHSEPDLHVVARDGGGAVVVPVAVRGRTGAGLDDAASGLSVAIALHHQHPDRPTLILSRSGEAAAGDGVCGLLLHAAPENDLAGAVLAMTDPGRSGAANAVVALATEGALVAAAGSGGAASGTAGDLPHGAGCPLSPRELEVLRRTAHGESVREIAGSLHLAEGTVRNHLTAIGTKLQARTRVDSVRIARTAGWIAA
ncbi:response regulator transcription factor [Dactylosporangium aurantiacum]|uniref:Response regulator transcription factor n=1 Tax=Dactylosporangium aurantiacum TaxID=35754 RepID=A0A9Q9MMQ5_9ACTN|nr:response regulator transcription factor [Dactylosporangium aurantiacum]MDG6109104.1 response regulator transcription factor [Dactylosporangium aurantiacum]UWZ58436.1 response regulator transcription factor [Dactylosporangium aurantiacum]